MCRRIYNKLEENVKRRGRNAFGGWVTLSRSKPRRVLRGLPIRRESFKQKTAAKKFLATASLGTSYGSHKRARLCLFVRPVGLLVPLMLVENELTRLLVECCEFGELQFTGE